MWNLTSVIQPGYHFTSLRNVIKQTELSTTEIKPTVEMTGGSEVTQFR